MLLAVKEPEIFARMMYLRSTAVALGSRLFDFHSWLIAYSRWMVRGEAFLGMASLSSTMVGTSSIVAAHADWEDYPRYVKQHGPSLVMQWQ